jgi:hypothetical protein
MSDRTCLDGLELGCIDGCIVGCLDGYIKKISLDDISNCI